MKRAQLVILLFMMLTPTLSHALCVTSDHVKLRTKPDASSKVAWVVGRNMPLLEVDRKGAWIQVQDFEKSKYWVHARNVTSRGNCVIVRARQASLRAGPGTQFGPTDLGFVRKYTTFKKLERDEDWIKVQDSFGEIHWVNETALWEARSTSRISF